MITYNLLIDDKQIDELQWLNYSEETKEITINFSSSMGHRKRELINLFNNAKSIKVIDSNGKSIETFDTVRFMVSDVKNRIIPDNLITFTINVTE